MLYHTAPLNDAVIPHCQLQNYFKDQVKCMFYAEKQLFGLLENIHSSVRMDELKKALSDYSLQLQAQLMRLEEIFGLLLIDAGTGPCETIDGLIREMNRTLTDAKKSSVTKDAAIVLSVRKAIYYKMAAYSALEMLADSQGMEEACNLLHLSLEDEKDSDMVLSDIAERRIKNL